MTPDPQSLGPYRIVRRAGVGGMGVVYEAVHTGLDKRVALKVLPRELAANRLERFLREARTAAGLHHTNIVPVFDVGQVDGVPYYAMQFIDGRPLGATAGPTGTRSLNATASFVASGRREPAGSDAAQTGGLTPPARPDVKLVVAQVLQAAEGVAFAHDRGVVHRDIKPANLLLDSEGVVWVADFGLAFRSDDPAMTADGAILGTPRYMSPEQARGEKTDARTDVYSLGVTLYELLTGAEAFPGDTPLDVIQKVLEHTPPHPRSLDRRVSRDLETVVLRAMAKRREDRYATGREFADDLRRFLNGEPVRARRIGPVGRAWRWSKRNPEVASLLAAVLLVFALGAGVSGFYAKRAALREADAKRNGDAATVIAGQLGDTVATLKDEQARGRRLLYDARMSLAGVSLGERNYDRVAELLTDTFPQPGEPDVRGWEWHYLFRQLFGETRRLDATTGRHPLLLGPTRYVHTQDNNGETDLLVGDTATGKVLVTRKTPQWFALQRACVSGDGRRLFGWSASRSVVWDIEAGREVRTLPTGRPSFVNTPSFALSHAGEKLAWIAEASGDGRDAPAVCEVWDVGTGMRTVLPAPDKFGSIALSRSLVFSPDARRLAVLDEYGRCVVWDLAAKSISLDIEKSPKVEPHRGRTPEKFAPGMSFSPDGTRFAVRRTALDGFEVHAFDGAKARLVYTTADIPPQVEGVEFSPDGTRVLVTQTDGEMYVCDTTGRHPRQRFRFVGSGQHAAFFRPDGKAVFLYDGATVREWDLTRPPAARLPGTFPEFAVGQGHKLGQFSRDGSRLALFGSWGGDSDAHELHVLTLADGSRRVTPTSAFGKFFDSSSVTWSWDGKWVGVSVNGVPSLGGLDGPAPLWHRVAAEGARSNDQPADELLLFADAAAGRVVKTHLFRGERNALLRTSPCGRWAAFEGNHSFAVLDTSSWRVVREYPGVKDRYVYMVFAPDSRLIVVRDGAKDGADVEAFVWNPETGVEEPLASPGGKSFGVAHVSPDGQWLVARVEDENNLRPRLRCWDMRAAGYPVVAELSLPGETALYEQITFSPDSRWVAVVSTNRLVRLIAAGTWEVRHTLTKPGGDPDLYFTPDGRRLIGFHTDRLRQVLKVWDTDTGQEVLTVPCHAGDGIVDGLAPHFDGGRLTFARAAGPTRQIELETLDGTPVPDELARERLGIE